MDKFTVGMLAGMPAGIPAGTILAPRACPRAYLQAHPYAHRYDIIHTHTFISIRVTMVSQYSDMQICVIRIQRHARSVFAK